MLNPSLCEDRYALSPEAVNKAATAKVKDGAYCHLHFAPAAPQKGNRRPPSTQVGIALRGSPL